MTNMSPIEHNVTIAEGTKVLGATPTFTGGTKAVTLNLKPGKYVFYCSVPGHRAGGDGRHAGGQMKLYVCWGTFPTPRPGGHPCANAYHALRDAGYDPRGREGLWAGVLPGVFNQTSGRREVQELTGNRMVPDAGARRRRRHRRLQGDRRVGSARNPANAA